MPKVEGTFKPPSLRVTRTKAKKPKPFPAKLYPRKTQIYTHKTVSKPLFNSGQCRSFSTSSTKTRNNSSEEGSYP
jgi:hypothetical protein